MYYQQQIVLICVVLRYGLIKLHEVMSFYTILESTKLIDVQMPQNVNVCSLSLLRIIYLLFSSMSIGFLLTYWILHKLEYIFSVEPATNAEA